MKQPHPSADYSIVCIMGYDSENKVYECQIAPVGVGGSSIPAETRHPLGFLAFASDGDSDNEGNYTNGAFVRTDKEGSTLHALVLDDLRVTSRLPTFPKGATVHYGTNPGVPSYSVHDGDGNYEIKCPSAKSITIHLDGGPPIVFQGSLVKIGDTPVVLAKGPAFESLITVLEAFAAAMIALTPPSTPVTNATLNTLGTNLQTALQALTDLVTTQLEGT